MIAGEREKIQRICDQLITRLVVAQGGRKLKAEIKKWCLKIEPIPQLVLECLKLNFLTPNFRKTISMEINTLQKSGELAGLLKRESQLKKSIDSLLIELESELFVDSLD